MEIIRNLYTNLKLTVLREEYKKISDIDSNITKLYDIIIKANEDDRKIYYSEVFLLMSEYLPIDLCPLMRELIRELYNYTDSYNEENNKDINKINEMNYNIIYTLYNF
jgi:hypothetical protein